LTILLSTVPKLPTRKFLFGFEGKPFICSSLLCVPRYENKYQYHSMRSGAPWLWLEPRSSSMSRVISPDDWRVERHTRWGDRKWRGLCVAWPPFNSVTVSYIRCHSAHMSCLSVCLCTYVRTDMDERILMNPNLEDTQSYRLRLQTTAVEESSHFQWKLIVCYFNITLSLILHHFWCIYPYNLNHIIDIIE
jgi:hypothetical protein